MEARFLAALAAHRQEAAALGVRIRPLAALGEAKRCLSGSRQSDGFADLARLGRLELSLEALATDRRFTALFSDDEANTALTRLLEAGYYHG